MLEDFMGDSFQAGINAFLKKYAYANAVTKDLWTELTLAWEGNHPEGEKVRTSYPSVWDLTVVQWGLLLLLDYLYLAKAFKVYPVMVMGEKIEKVVHVTLI